MQDVRTLVVDDHEIIRYAVCQMLKQQTGKYSFIIAGEADNGRMAVEQARQLRPDLIIMDISMPEMNGIEATRQIKAICPRCHVVILTMYDRLHFLRELIQLGISGYVHKSRVFDDLLNAVHSAMENEVFLCRRAAKLISEDYAAIIGGKIDTAGQELSPRQREVLQLVVEGKSTKEIAVMLRMSPKAVESMRYRIMQKLGIDNLADLTKYALQEGLTTLDF